VPGGNVVYSSSLLRRLPPSPSDTDLSYHTRLLDAGVTIEIQSGLELSFAHPPRFVEYIRERFWLSRRIGMDGGVLKLVFAPLLPFVVVFRAASCVLKKGGNVPVLLACLPAIFLMGLVQSAGEFIGALTRTDE
jgi:hypothetical protein